MTGFPFWIPDPWRWDRYFVLKRQYEIATTLCIKTHRNVVLSSCAHLSIFQKNQFVKDSLSSRCYYCVCTLNIPLPLHSLSMEVKVFWLEFIDAESILVTWHAPHALTWTWPNTRRMLITWAEVYPAISPREFKMEQTNRCDVVIRKLPALE